MLFWTEVALDRETSGDMMLSDMGQGFNFRPGAFDGAISISVLAASGCELSWPLRAASVLEHFGAISFHQFQCDSEVTP